MTGACAVIALGVRLTFHRENWTRVLALFAWATLAILTATMATTVPIAMNRAGRVQLRRAPVNPPAVALTPVAASAQFVERSSIYRGARVRLIELIGQPDGLPLGVDRAPGPGEVVVSPALGRILDDPDRRGELEQRVPGQVVGRIADEGLAYPDELIAYVGLDAAARPTSPTDPLAGWGLSTASAADEQLPRPAAIAFGLVVGIPLVGLFVAGMTFGSRRRQQVLWRLRLLGARSALEPVLLLAETVLPVAVGVLVGIALMPVVARAVAAQFPVAVRPFASDLGALPAAAQLRVVGFVVCIVLVGCYVSARSLGQVERRRRSTGIRTAAQWTWPILLLVSIGGTIVVSGRSGVPGAAIIVAAAGVATSAVLSLRPLTALTAGCLHRATGRLAPDLALARLRYAGSATMRGAQGVVCVLIALGIGIGVVQVLDAALTVSEVIWKPRLVHDDAVFVSTTAVGIRHLQEAPVSPGPVPAILGYATLDSGATRRTAVVPCDGVSRLAPGFSGACPQVVVKPGDPTFSGPSTLHFGSLAIDVGPAEHRDVAAPSEFFGDLDAAIVAVDTSTWNDVQTQVPATPFRDLAVLQIPSDRPANVEQVREMLWSEPSLPFSGGRSSLATVVTKQDLVDDGEYYTAIYGTLMELTGWLLLAIFAVGAVFGAVADVLDGREQADRLEILGAATSTQRAAQSLRSMLPFVVAVALGTSGGMALGIAYSRLSRYRDVLTGPFAGFPVPLAIAGAVAGLVVLVTLVGGVVLLSDGPDPLTRLRDR